jgi:hypothetical protein
MVDHPEPGDRADTLAHLGPNPPHVLWSCRPAHELLDIPAPGHHSSIAVDDRADPGRRQSLVRKDPADCVSPHDHGDVKLGAIVRGHVGVNADGRLLCHETREQVADPHHPGCQALPMVPVVDERQRAARREQSVDDLPPVIRHGDPGSRDPDRRSRSGIERGVILLEKLRRGRQRPEQGLGLPELAVDDER